MAIADARTMPMKTQLVTVLSQELGADSVP
jgi:hypothetical protein